MQLGIIQIHIKSDLVTLTYWINTLQNLKTKKDYFVSLNETSHIEQVIERISYDHPQFNREAINMQKRKNEISGQTTLFMLELIGDMDSMKMDFYLQMKARFRRSTGFAKLVADAQSGQLLGATIVGECFLY